MSISNTPVNYRDSKIAGLINDIRNGHAWLWNSVWLMMLVAALLLVVSGFDHRLINGVDVWDKPAKFFLAVAAQFATVNWALTKQIGRAHV